GKVYAIEVQKDFLITIKNKANDTHLTNIEPIWGDIENIGGTKLKDEIIDRVIASNILFQVTNKQKFIDEAFRILKPEGKILLIDWSDSPDSFSLKQNIIVNKNQAREMFEKKGFVYERDIDAGAHHYGMILKKENNNI
ncbi:MAG: methyltransferase domain-containing protein, partial [Candidatus Magasanikiibacteriota bacterium]